MAIEGHEFVEAYFFNNERTLVESVWTDGKHNRTQHIEAKEGNKDWEDLLTRIDIDALHEATYNFIKRQNEAFEDTVIKIAKDRGMIYDFDEQNTDVYKAFVQVLFSDFDPERDKEKLFLYKLQLFEADQVKKSKSTSKKKQLRQAKTMIEATKVALSMVE
tara:strand:- start:2241 stop:2723 length:483 start_codon:yes stop_codon:yes gene_type:complete